MASLNPIPPSMFSGVLLPLGLLLPCLSVWVWQGRGFLIRHLVSLSTLHSAPVNNHLINPQYKNTSFPASPCQIVLPTSCASLPSSHPHAASAHSSSHSTLLSSLPFPCLLQHPHHLCYNKSTCFSTTIQLCLCLHLGPNQQPSQNNLAAMDPADTDSLRQALASQGALVGQHDKVLHELVENLRALSSNVIRLGSQMDQVNAHLTASYASSATVASPADPPPALPTPPPGHATPAPLAPELRKVFDHPVQGKEAANRLLSLRQGSKSVAEYAVEFRILAAENNRLRERCRERTGRPHAPTSPFLSKSAPRVIPDSQSFISQPLSSSAPPSMEEPMQLGRACLSPSERQRRVQAGVCIYCGKAGHFLASCPHLPKD
ncbi:uncharacterized protein LOC119478845 [Sebastes umbrosus]|uniref:uncharacterized protein LOC119478845 n=1 Tax=Sebastes umbrosus TaxID=72105 RepID=UPI00189C9B18|nr:uncharacterized protein LOC119478845 [Sebastes umbrosus]